jgi:hypothetical protein
VHLKEIGNLKKAIEALRETVAAGFIPYAEVRTRKRAKPRDKKRG